MTSAETTPDSRPVLLEVRDVVVHYGRIKALHSVSVTVHDDVARLQQHRSRFS